VAHEKVRARLSVRSRRERRSEALCIVAAAYRARWFRIESRAPEVVEFYTQRPIIGAKVKLREELGRKFEVWLVPSKQWPQVALMEHAPCQAPTKGKPGTYERRTSTKVHICGPP
jgi:hypothetical protein